jgi:hypothetical protein
MMDTRTGLWFVRSSLDLHERGLFVDLAGYQSQVFLAIHEERDNEFGHYAQLSDELAGRGVPDLAEALQDTALRPLVECWASVASSRRYEEIGDALAGLRMLDEHARTDLAAAYRRFLALAGEYRPETAPMPAGEAHSRVVEAEATLLCLLKAATTLPYLDQHAISGDEAVYRTAVEFFTDGLQKTPIGPELLTTWLLLVPLEDVFQPAAALCDEWGLDRRASRGFRTPPADDSWRVLLRILLTHRRWWRNIKTASGLIEELSHDVDLTAFLELNEHEGKVWFNKERSEELLWWLFAVALIDTSTQSEDNHITCPQLIPLHRFVTRLMSMVDASGFELDRLITLAQDAEETG